MILDRKGFVNVALFYRIVPKWKGRIGQKPEGSEKVAVGMSES
jgi:hypothetical protein